MSLQGGEFFRGVYIVTDLVFQIYMQYYTFTILNYIPLLYHLLHLLDFITILISYVKLYIYVCAYIYIYMVKDDMVDQGRKDRGPCEEHPSKITAQDSTNSKKESKQTNKQTKNTTNC